MKKIKLASNAMMLLVLFFIIYNTYFGWNMLAMSDPERTCDYIFQMGMYGALAVYFLPLLDVYKDFIKRFEGKQTDR